MPRWPSPRRAAPPSPEDDGDRNGEPAELDWGCISIVVCILCLLVVLVMLLIGSTFPTDRVYSSSDASAGQIRV